MIRIALASGFVLVCAAAFSGPAIAAESGPGPACLTSDTVRGAEVLDNRTLLFHMADGKILINHLSEPCDGLPAPDKGLYEGIRANAYICGGKDVVRIREHSVCHLGAFAQYGEQNAATDLRDPAQR